MQKFENIQKELVDRIKLSRSKLKIAVTWFTNNDLFNLLLHKLKHDSIQIELIILNDRINNKIEGCDFQSFIDANGRFYYSDVNSMVHHKFCIIDDELVITGSYNWTYYAENRNWENIVVIQDSSIVKGYVDEFEKIKNAHTEVKTISKSANTSVRIDENDYLSSDYMYQASEEKRKGNELKAAKIYTELLRIDDKQSKILNERNEILNKINNEKFEVSPYEIGILFQSGYTRVIPAFTPLPFSITKAGFTTVENQESISIKIQKFDIVHQTIIELKLKDIKPSPKGTKKVEHNFTLEQSGLLIIDCREVEGYRSVRKKTNIINYL
jgi:hypothetical protein